MDPEKKALLRLFFGFFLVYLLFMNPSPDSSITLNNLHLAISLVDHRSVALSTYQGTDVAFHDGSYYSGHPPGSGFLAAAVYQILRPIFPRDPNKETIFWLNFLCILVLSAPACTLSMFWFYRIINKFPIGPQAATLTMFAAAFGTASFGYAGAFYKKSIAGWVAMGAVYLIWARTKTGPEETDDSGQPFLRYFLAGLLSGFCVLLDYSMAFIVLFFLIYLLVTKISRRGLALFLVGGAVIAIPLFVYHHAAFGSLLATSYTFRVFGDEPVYRGFRLLRALRILLGIRCGLLTYTPIVLIGFVGCWLAIRNRVFKNEILLLVISPTVVYVLFYSVWSTGYVCGGESLGPRQMVSLFPILMLPVALGLERTPRALSRTLILVSFGFSYLGAQSFYIPTEPFPIVYAVKSAILSLGTGQLFSRTLPLALGIETPLSNAVSGGVSKLLSTPGLLAKRFAGQLLFAVVQWSLIFGVWHLCFRGFSDLFLPKGRHVPGLTTKEHDA